MYCDTQTHKKQKKTKTKKEKGNSSDKSPLWIEITHKAVTTK